MRKHYMICVDNQAYKASLETRKLYQVLSDKEAGQNHQIRVIDESDEDYQYPEGYFASVRLPSETKQRLELTAA